MNKQITEKTCTRCEVEKPVEEFYGIKRSRCKECERVEASERMKRYNGTFRGKASGALQTSKKAVRRIERETGRKVKDDLTLYDVAIVLDDVECTYCGEYVEEKDRTMDHITPIRYSFENTYSLITMACKTCNSRKGEKPAFEYFIEQGVPYEEFVQVVDRIAQRKRISFGEAFIKLVDDMGTYYETLLEREKEKMVGNTE